MVPEWHICRQLNRGLMLRSSSAAIWMEGWKFFFIFYFIHSETQNNAYWFPDEVLGWLGLSVIDSALPSNFSVNPRKGGEYETGWMDIGEQRAIWNVGWFSKHGKLKEVNFSAYLSAGTFAFASEEWFCTSRCSRSLSDSGVDVFTMSIVWTLDYILQSTFCEACIFETNVGVLFGGFRC